MDIHNMQVQVDQTEYWDENILDFKTAFFGDEAYLYIYKDNEKCWEIRFLACYEVTYKTDADRRSIPLVRDMNKPQLGYYGQNIEISNSDIQGFYRVDMDLSIMEIELICKNIEVEEVDLRKISLPSMASEGVKFSVSMGKNLL